MDAHAHLRGLGWRGTGYSLDTEDRGLAKPLLISHRIDNRGLGSKSQKENQANRWWLNAFDSALKNLDEAGSSALAQVQIGGFKSGGLYGWFVKGGSTFSSDTSGSSTPQLVHGNMADDMAETPQPISKKRKAEDSPDAPSKKVKKGKKAKKTKEEIEEKRKKRAEKKKRKKERRALHNIIRNEAKQAAASAKKKVRTSLDDPQLRSKACGAADHKAEDQIQIKGDVEKSLTRKERQKLRQAKKLKMQQRLTAQIMTERGKSKNNTTKQELVEYRKQARKMLKEQKKLKRNKVIHRNKTG